MKYSIPFLIAILVSMWWSFSPSTAQQPVLPTPEAACVPYFLPQETAVRTCANISCAISQTLSAGQNVCVIGTADDPNWLWVDLDPFDEANPPLYLPKDALNPNAANSNPRFSSCQSMLVNGDQTNLYSCADTTCRVVGVLFTDEWVCAREYTSGQYTGWAFAEMSDRSTSGWLSLSSLRPSQNYRQDAPVYQPPAANNSAPVQVARVDAAPPTNLENSSAPLDLPRPLPPCQQYQVLAYQTNVRECASLNCAIASSLANGANVCVRGITPNRGWLIVDLSPQDPESPLYAVYENAVAPSIDFQEVSLGANACFDRWKVNTEITAIVRSCPSLTCTPIDRLEYGDEVCAVAYGGAFQEWVQVTGAEVVQNGWMHSSLLLSANLANANNPNLPPVSEVAQLQATPLATPAPTAIPLTQEAQDVSLAQLNIPNVELNNNRLTYRFQFTLPPTWQITNGIYLSLNLNYFNILPSSAEGITPSVLAVRLDDVLIASIELDDSIPASQDVVVRIPEALFTRRADRLHNVSLELLDEESCRAGGSAFVLMDSNSSFFHFEYKQSTPLLDLAQYPQPLYSPTLGRNPEVIYLVLPDNPSRDDIQAGALIAMGLGSSTRNQAKIGLRTPSSLTESEQNNHALILVGNPETHQLIRQFYENNSLPTQLNADGQLVYNNVPLTPEQGVWQLTSNPANDLYPVAIVTGTSTAGIYHAAHTLTGTVNLFTGSLAIVDGLRPPLPPSRFAADVSFQEIGYGNILLTSQSDQYVEFEIPYTAQITQSAQLGLNFQISPALQSQNSDFSVWLNDEFPVSSLNLQTLSSDSTGTYRLDIPLPADLLRRGQSNTFRFSVTGTNQNEDPCNRQRDSNSLQWINLNAQSRISLPYQDFVFSPQNLRLSDFPQPFSSQRNLADLLISLPLQPSQKELEQVYQLLAIIAANTDDGGSFLPKFAFGDFPPETDLAQYDMLVVGRPSTNPLLQQLNPILVQGFEADNLSPRYSTAPTHADLGILQVIPSIWSPTHAILVISGTSELGQSNAMNILLSPETDPAQLAGDLTFVNGLSLITLRSYEN